MNVNFPMNYPSDLPKKELIILKMARVAVDDMEGQGAWDNNTVDHELRKAAITKMRLIYEAVFEEKEKV